MIVTDEENLHSHMFDHFWKHSQDSDKQVFTVSRKLSRLMSIIVNNSVLNTESPHLLPQRAPETFRGTLSPDRENEMCSSVQKREENNLKRTKSFTFGC